MSPPVGDGIREPAPGAKPRASTRYLPRPGPSTRWEQGQVDRDWSLQGRAARCTNCFAVVEVTN